MTELLHHCHTDCSLCFRLQSFWPLNFYFGDDVTFASKSRISSLSVIHMLKCSLLDSTQDFLALLTELKDFDNFFIWMLIIFMFLCFMIYQFEFLDAILDFWFTIDIILTVIILGVDFEYMKVRCNVIYLWFCRTCLIVVWETVVALIQPFAAAVEMTDQLTNWRAAFAEKCLILLEYSKTQNVIFMPLNAFYVNKIFTLFSLLCHCFLHEMTSIAAVEPGSLWTRHKAAFL